VAEWQITANAGIQALLALDFLTPRTFQKVHVRCGVQRALTAVANGHRWPQFAGYSCCKQTSSLWSHTIIVM